MNDTLPPELAAIDTLGHESPIRTPLPPDQKLYVPPRPRLRYRDNLAQTPQIQESWPPSERVRLLVTAYMSGIKRVYGFLPKRLHPHTGLHVSTHRKIENRGETPTTGDLKEFPLLAEAADYMHEIGTVPHHWCEWYATELRKVETTSKSGKVSRRWEKNPPSLTTVYSMKALTRWRGRCRMEMRSRTPEGRTLLVSPLEIEANLRIQEINRINAGWSRETALIGPRWYCEKREKEIAMGHTDPGDLFPREFDE